MTSHTDTHILPYTPEQLFALVADVESYPKFLPWCRAARILKREENVFTAELAITFKGFTESYVSRVTLLPHERIDVKMESGPFEHLVNQWTFIPHAGGTQLEFFLDFRFRSRMLEMLIGGLFDKASRKMTDAFKARAEIIYDRLAPANAM